MQVYLTQISLIKMMVFTNFIPSVTYFFLQLYINFQILKSMFIPMSPSTFIFLNDWNGSVKTSFFD